MYKIAWRLLFIFGIFTTFYEVNAQDLKYTNTLNYWGEAINHTSPNDGQDNHLIGWLLNTSELSFGKHSLNVGLMLTHGGEPSVNIVGDLQTFSNLEAGFLYGFYEVFYQYRGKEFWVKIGQQDINTDFLVSETALQFAHSSFGVDPVTTVNMPAPTYPVTGFSLTGAYTINEKVGLKLGIFDGQFANPKNDYLGIDWSLNKEEGLLYIIEPSFQLFNDRLTQKIGFYHHSGLFTNNENGVNQKGLNAFYWVNDIILHQSTQYQWNAFTQFATSSRLRSDISSYFGIGLSWSKMMEGEPLWTLGLAVGHAELNEELNLIQSRYNLDNETIIELNFRYQLKEWIQLQPYIEYVKINRVINDQKDPFIFAIRANLQF